MKRLFSKRESEYLMDIQESLTEEIIISVASFYGDDD